MHASFKIELHKESQQRSKNDRSTEQQQSAPLISPNATSRDALLVSRIAANKNCMTTTRSKGLVLVHVLDMSG